MTALMLLTLFACTKTKDADGEDDTKVTTDDTGEVVEMGTITGKADYPGGGLSSATKLHIAIKSGDLEIWADSAYREVHDNPTLPFTFTFEAPAGTYYVGAYLDLTGDSAGGPNQGDPEGIAKAEGGPYQAVVVANETLDVPPINMKVKEPQGK